MEQNSPASPALILLGDGYTVNTAAVPKKARDEGAYRRALKEPFFDRSMGQIGNSWKA
jgi:hypothetical protein